MRQLMKFCAVGASSTLIDKSIQALLLVFVPVLPWWVSQSISFIFGVTNGFIWNRKWTFKSDNHAAMSLQYRRFVASNVIGLSLNLLITKGFLVLFTGQLKHAVNPDPKINIIASLCAVPIVVIWNFSASRLWTFKNHAPQPAHNDSIAPIAPPH